MINLSPPRYLVALGALAVVGLWSIVHAQPSAEENEPAGRKWALLVGVNRYDEFRDLRYCVNDTQKLKQALMESGFPEEHIIVLNDEATDPAFKPTKANIERAWIRLLEDDVREGDTVFLSFSGHGVNIQGQSEMTVRTESGRKLDSRSYLCPSDAVLDRYQSTMLSVEDLLLLLNRSPATQKVFVVDACRNEVHPERLERLDLLVGLRTVRTTETELAQGLILMSGCLSGQLSVEDEDVGGGLFMHYIARGLTGHADYEIAGNRDGRISPTELFQYAAAHTREHSYRTKGWRQQPWFKGELTDNLAIATLTPHQQARLERTTAETPVVETAEQQHAQALYAEAVVALRDFQIPHVIELMDTAIELDPEYKAAYRMRGMAYRFLGDLKRAVEDYERAGELVSIRVPADEVRIVLGNEQVETARYGDFLSVSKVTTTRGGNGTEANWLRVEAIQNYDREAKQWTRRSTEGYVDMARVNVEPSDDQRYQMVRRFQTDQQQPLATYAHYQSADRAENAAVAMQRYNQVAAIVNQFSGGRSRLPIIGAGGGGNVGVGPVQYDQHIPPPIRRWLPF
jgi:uncharacterized caspase-like protein